MVPFHDHYETGRHDSDLRRRAEGVRLARERRDGAPRKTGRLRWGLLEAVRSVFVQSSAVSSASVSVRGFVVEPAERTPEDRERRCA